MFDQLDQFADRLRDLEAQLSDPAVTADAARYTALAKQHAELAPVVAAHARYLALTDDLGAARELAEQVTGDDRRELQAEVEDLTARRTELEGELRRLLVPADPDDDKDVIVEVRAAAGGDEAGLFAGELVEMYHRYASTRGWSTRSLSRTEQGIGGVKEAVLEITGTGAFAHLKHESGVHRVQRVPATESQGRIHTSTASVAVLPVAEEVDVHLDANDLRIDVFRASGPGGQSVNTTDSAVRITHLPSGLSVSCQDEKSQHQNRDKALTILRARLLQAEQEAAQAARAQDRRGQIGTGDRAEKIRTYNAPQSRITDHRIGLTVHDVAGVLAGDLDQLLGPLRQAEQEAKLAALDDGPAREVPGEGSR